MLAENYVNHTYLTYKESCTIFLYDPVWFTQHYIAPCRPKPGGRHLKNLHFIFLTILLLLFFKN